MVTDLDSLGMEIRRSRRKIDQEYGEARAIALRGKAVKDEIETLKVEAENLERAAAVLASIGEERQAAAQAQVEELVTRGLKSVFGEELSFHVVQTTKGKTPIVEFVIRSTIEGQPPIETDVMSARGGGVATVVGFLLRVVVMLLSKDRQETVLFLDETFSMVSAEYLPNVVEFLRELVDKTDIRIVLVTHQPEFLNAADKRYEFKRVNGETQVREI